TRGKFAVVVGIEVDNVFGCRTEADYSTASLGTALSRYYALGVRHVFPVHFGDNGFAGAAFQNELNGDASGKRDINPLRTYWVETDDGTAVGYTYRGGRKNVRGLTDLGKTLIEEMMNHGMIVDVDHMSLRSRADALDIAERRGCPVVSSHVGFIEISREDKR